MKEPKLTEANYTKLYRDLNIFIKTQIRTLLDRNFLATDFTERMSHVFEAKYNFYELCTDNDQIFVECVTNVYTEYINYYKELYDNYKKQYDYALGNKRTMARHDVSHSERDITTSTSDSGTRKDYDLPNKVVDPTSEDGYLTGKSVNSGEGTSRDAGSKDSTYDSTIINTYDNEFLDLKKKYLAQIRNLYEEFAEKFSDCFLHLFS